MNSDYFRDEASQFLQSSATGGHDDDRDWTLAGVPLVCETLIDCNEGIESTIRGDSQEFPVSVTRPTHLLYRACFK